MSSTSFQEDVDLAEIRHAAAAVEPAVELSEDLRYYARDAEETAAAEGRLDTPQEREAGERGSGHTVVCCKFGGL